ncbi:MAG TPA: hypothetical protein VFK70_03270 [Vicinamibacteria bacterium]|nr:hypothetical protein [Vicinamibacteria bacterium]
MRVWFMVGAMVLGIIGVWGQQGRGGQGSFNRGGGTVSAQDGGSTVPSPKAP